MIGRQGKRKASMVILAIFVSILLIGQSITLAYAEDLELNQAAGTEQKEDAPAQNNHTCFALALSSNHRSHPFSL